MAYATTSELESRWRPLTPDERVRAEALLDDAAAIIDTVRSKNVGNDILRIVSCNMVRRAMSVSGDAFELDGQIVDSPTWDTSLPAGNLWLSASDRRLLNRRAKIGFVSMADLNEPQ